MTHVICRLTAKNRDHLRNPTLCNGVWATFTFLLYSILRSGPVRIPLIKKENSWEGGLHSSATGVGNPNPSYAIVAMPRAPVQKTTAFVIVHRGSCAFVSRHGNGVC